MNALDYLLRVNLYLLIFCGCYYLLLRRHTFFRLNRIYLLLSVGFALRLPLVELPDDTVAAMPTVSPQLLEAVTVSPDTATSTESDWVMLGWYLYGAIAVGMLLRLGWRTARLVRFIRDNPHHHLPGYTLVQPSDPETPTFSFFHYLVLNTADIHSEPVRKHEMEHIRQRHSADVLFFEVLQAMFWYNPVMLAYRMAIREVHEFLADQAASGRHRSDYASYLVSYALGDHHNVLTNSFFTPSLLRSRLRMLQQRTTTQWALGRYALVIPITAVALSLTAARTTTLPAEDSFMQSGQQAKKPLVRGRVVDQNNNPLPGATIVVKGKRMGTTTDANGNYTLFGIKAGSRLIVNFIGFQGQEITVREGSLTTVTLQPKRQDRQALKTTATPKTSKPKAGVGDIVPFQAPETDANGNPTEHVTTTTPFPAPGITSIRLNGSGGLSGGSPLYILDGVRMGKDYSLNTLNPADIESINVLKGASAQALYGEAGTDGVIIISTKNGRKK